MKLLVTLVRRVQLLSLGLIFGFCAAGVSASDVVHHSLQVVIVPADGSLNVTDDITMSAPSRRFEFTLNKLLQPTLADRAGQLVELGSVAYSPTLRKYRVLFAEERASFSVHYAGIWAGSSEFESGHVSELGVFLHRGSGWFPDVPASLLTFSMHVSQPSGWNVISQGRRLQPDDGRDGTIEWFETQPQNELYLVGGPLTRFQAEGEIADAEVYLHSSDDAPLAATYLDATARYLALYTGLIGPYPYQKFALVENFWETGFGMPSFTLLGPTVLRLPFIVYTSYPHEIVHNWWGNGVFVDYQSGNWSEGLTAYLSDHLLRELRGEDASYRRDALQKYRNYVDVAEDFALTDFISRHGDVSEAVGYNKTTMLFHMLRQRLGDKQFVNGLRELYRAHRFTRTSFTDVAAAFERVSGQPLTAFFDQWTRRIGAPQITLGNVHVTAEPGGSYSLQGELSQEQPGEPFSLAIPIYIQNATGVERFVVEMNRKKLTFSRVFGSQPLRLMVDPEFDVLRRLDQSETPASLGELFGGAPAAAVVPADLDDEQALAYHDLARMLGAESVYRDDQVGEIPGNRPLWLLGWDNQHDGLLASLVGRAERPADSVDLGGEVWRRDQHCVVSVGRQLTRTVAWVGCDRPTAFESLARKLRHYGKYSYLGFESETLQNRLKGRWPVVDSSLHRPLVESLALPAPDLPQRPQLTDVAPLP
jgi:aminopeptidase N